MDGPARERTELADKKSDDRDDADDCIAYSIADAERKSGISRSRLYEAMAAKKLFARKNGRATIIRRVDLKAYIDSLPLMHPPDGDAD